MYVKAKRNTPVFNTKQISLLSRFDDRHLNRSLETVAYPDTLFSVEEDDGTFLTVKLKEYPSSNKLYIFKSFVNPCTENPEERKREMPTKEVILKRLESFPHLPYIWGGNIPGGVPELPNLLAMNRPLNAFESNYLQLKGVDCSGLIYHVTDGALPRNCSDLLTIGHKVSTLKPLDLVIWPEHLLIALPNNRLIECCEFYGRLITEQRLRLAQLEHFAPIYLRWH